MYFMAETNRVQRLEVGCETERSQGFGLSSWKDSFCQLTCGWNRCGWKVLKCCLHTSGWRRLLDIPVEAVRRQLEITKPEPEGEAGTRGVNVGVGASSHETG